MNELSLDDHSARTDDQTCFVANNQYVVCIISARHEIVALRELGFTYIADGGEDTKDVEES